MDHPAHGVQKLGQSIWYDNIRRGLITSGELHALVNEGGVLDGLRCTLAALRAEHLEVDLGDLALAVLDGLRGARQVTAGNRQEPLGLVDLEIPLLATVVPEVYARAAGAKGSISTSGRVVAEASRSSRQAQLCALGSAWRVCRKPGVGLSVAESFASVSGSASSTRTPASDNK